MSSESAIVYFSEREIWFASIGLNIGIEEYGKNELFERPILVLKKFNEKMLFAIPLTTKVKSSRYQILYELEGAVFGAKISQARPLDSKRLLRKIGVLDSEQFQRIRNSFKKIM